MHSATVPSPTFSVATPPKAPAVPRGLLYVNDVTLPGITRERVQDTFLYRDPSGTIIEDEAEIQRIRKLAIPPAYTDVWICPIPNGHLQATGRDARGRKQYRYHAEWNLQRNEDKFIRLEAFGEALPRIRRRVTRDLASDKGRALTYKVVLATLVRLLDTTFVRVGNEEYARENRSYGLTTLRNRHAGVTGNTVRLSFRGKHGVQQDVSLQDRQVVRVIRRCKHLPGQELFQYEEDGEVRGIGSGDVNDYISEAAGERFTAKDFRTWHGTVEALELTRLACTAQSGDSARFSTKTMLAAVAKRLGNTVAVCRKSYIHPAVLALGQTLSEDTAAMIEIGKRLGELQQSATGLQPEERRLLAFLKAHRKEKEASTRKTRKKVGGKNAASKEASPTPPIQGTPTKKAIATNRSPGRGAQQSLSTAARRHK